MLVSVDCSPITIDRVGNIVAEYSCVVIATLVTWNRETCTIHFRRRKGRHDIVNNRDVFAFIAFKMPTCNYSTLCISSTLDLESAIMDS